MSFDLKGKPGARKGAAMVGQQAKSDPMEAQLYDLRDYKRIMAPGRPEYRWRIAVLTLGTAAFMYDRQDSGPLLWLLAYLTSHGAYLWFTHRQADFVARRVLIWLAVFTGLAYASFGALGVALWISPEPLSQVLSVIMLTGVLLNALGERSAEPVMHMWDRRFCILLVGVYIAAMWLFVEAGGEHLVRSLILSVICAYYLVTARSVRAARDAEHQRRMTAERSAAVGQLSGGIAHDFNNLLTAVLGHIELARMSGDTAERDAMLYEAEQSARQGAALTHQLLAFSRRAMLRPRRLRLCDVLVKCIDAQMQARTDQRHINWHAPKGDMAFVVADPQQLAMVFEAVLDNAMLASPDEAVVDVRCRMGCRLGQAIVTVEVTDRGPGIAEDILPLVFEPYFTTRPQGQGSGLGLSMARGVVEQSGGSMEIRSKLGQGTCVLVHLPAEAKD